MIHGETEYALARLQARIGSRMRGGDWGLVSSARSLAAVVEQLRAGSLAPWVSGLGSASEAHSIEARLRARFREQIEEMASWANRSWQAALLWCRRLVDLPALRHAQLTQRDDLPDWPPADLAPFAGIEVDDAQAVELAWLAELQRRMPSLAAADRTEFALLRGILEQHRQRFSSLAAGNGWPERESLRRSLRTRLRRNPLSPVQQLTAVALLWLDYERVRGELLRLAALPPESPS